MSLKRKTHRVRIKIRSTKTYCCITVTWKEVCVGSGLSVAVVLVYVFAYGNMRGPGKPRFACWLCGSYGISTNLVIHLIRLCA